MNFDDYLHSKKIDSHAFRQAEPQLWESWSAEFDSVSPASFTAQKLYLINPIRRKYLLTVALPATNEAASDATAPTSGIEQMADQNSPKTPPAKIPVARPVFKAKPKMS